MTSLAMAGPSPVLAALPPTTIATPSVGSTFVQAGLYATAKMGENAFGYLGVSGEVRSGQTLAGVALGVRIQY